MKRGISVNGSYFKNGNLLGTKEIASGADSILDSLYKTKYGDEAFKNITDYTDYYNLSMSDEYIDMLPDSYYKEIGVTRQNVKDQMHKLNNAINKTKQQALTNGIINDFGNPSFENTWNVQNCAEVWSIRQAIVNGADWNKISFKCIEKSNGAYKSVCLNCQRTFDELLDLGE